jgi:alkylation response protein AidB-like acyl-CoA dehydrogenase
MRRLVSLDGVHSVQAGGGGDPVLLAQARLFAADAAMRHAVEAVPILGGCGMHRDHEVERLMRDARITQILDGTSEILALMVGREAVRGAAAF